MKEVITEVPTTTKDKIIKRDEICTPDSAEISDKY
jgi:hypothetical protein